MDKIEHTKIYVFTHLGGMGVVACFAYHIVMHLDKNVFWL